MLKRSILSLLLGVLLAATLALGMSAKAACGGLCGDRDPNCPDGGRFDSCTFKQSCSDSAVCPPYNVKCYYTCSRVIDDEDGPVN